MPRKMFLYVFMYPNTEEHYIKPLAHVANALYLQEGSLYIFMLDTKMTSGAIASLEG
jgi:hypothetical protein